MSTTIDERVVEMRFDNKQFESNVATSMSTLDKLKRSLKFDGASKGLEDINSAAKRVNMDGLGGAVESVKAKFSALDVIAVTALANITNSAVNAGKQLVSSLTIDQVTAGWNKYEQKTASVQTIMNATGKSIEDVNGYLDKLMWFSDETSYGFTDMTQAIAQMTAAGGDIEKLIPMVEGIANATAFAGKGAAEFSRAIYNLNQSYSMGYMQLIDWKSVEMAGASSKQLKQMFIDTAKALGTLNEAGETANGTLVTTATFANTLQEKWATSAVMEETYGRFAKVTEAAYEMVQDTTNKVDTASQAYKILSGELDEATLNSYDLSESQRALIGTFTKTEIAAAKSAQEAKSFSEVIDATKDAVSTGWMRTSEAIFGNYTQAKKLWSDMCEQFWEIFASGGDTRNDILTAAMTSSFDKISEEVKSAGVPIEEFQNKVIETAREAGIPIDELIEDFGTLSDVISAGKLPSSVIVDTIKKLAGTFTKASEAVEVTSGTLEHFQGLVNQVIRGDFGNGIDRINALTEAGENAAAIQTLVNKVWEKTGGTWSDTTITAEDLAEVIGDLSAEELETIGYTEDQAKALKQLAEEAEKTGTPINELLASLEKPSGRDLLFSTIHNALASLISVINTFREAWGEIFSEDRIASGLYNALSNIEAFSGRVLKYLDDHAEELKSTFKGLIAILDIFTSIIGGAFKAAFEILGEIFGGAGNSILNVTSNVGEAIVAFRDWLFENNLITRGFNKLVSAAKVVIKTIKAWIDTFKAIPAVQRLLEWIDGLFTSIDENGNKSAKSIEAFVGKFDGLSVVEGILNKISSAFSFIGNLVEDGIIALGSWFEAFKETEGVKQVVGAVTDLVSALGKLFTGEINANEFASALGKSLGELLASLPKIAIQLGKDFVAGFQNGITDELGGVITAVIEFCGHLISSFAEVLGIHSPSILTYVLGVFLIAGLVNGIKDSYGEVFGVFQPIVDFITNIFSSLWDYLTDESGKIEWDKIFAGGMAIESLVILKTFADSFEKIANALTSFSGIFSGVTKVLNNFSKVLDGVAWDFKAKAILKMAISIGILVAAVYVLAQIPSEKIGMMWNAVGIIVALAFVLVGLAWAMKQFSAASVEVNKEGASIKGIQSAILQIGLALLLTAAAVKIIADMDPEKAKRGFQGLARMAVGMLVFLAAMGGISRYSKDVSGIGKMMVKLSLAMILMVAVCKLIGMLSADEIGKGILFATAFSIFIMAITAVSHFANENVSKVGGMALKLSITMALLVGVCKLVGMLSYEEMLKGAAFAGAFVLFVWALVSVTQIGGDKQLAKVSGLILSVSFSLLLMVGVCKLINQIPIKDLVKGAIVVVGFMLLLKMMVGFLTIGSKQTIAKVSASVIAMSTAIAIMAGTAVILGMIDTADLAKGVIAVGILGTIMALMVHSLKGAQNVKGSIIAMAATIAIIAGSIVALSLIDDTESLIRATACIALVMGVYATIIHGLKGLQKGKISTGPLIALAGVTALMAGIIYLLANNIKDPMAAVAAAGSLSVLMLAMSVVLKILNSMQVDIKNALIGILALTAMILPLFAFVGVLAVMSNVSSAMTNVKALVILAGAMTVLLYALLPIGLLAATGIGIAIIVAGILALIAMILPLFAFVGVLAVMSNVKNAMTNTRLLTTFMTAMTDLLIKISSVAPLAVIGVAAMDNLILLLGAIGVMAFAIGVLIDKFPSIQKFLDTGLPVLEQLAASIGKMIDNFVGGIGEGLSDSFVKIGENISTLMDKLSEASEKASGIKGESFDGVKQLMGVIGDIALTTVGTSIGDIFTLGGTSMEKFEKDGIAFFNAMKTMGEASSEVNINEENMDAIIGVAKKLAELQSSLEPIGGIIDWFTGRDDLGTFGANAAVFVYSMKLAFGSLEGAELNTEAMNAIIAAATSLAELQHSLEPIGGVIDWFAGHDDLGTFGFNAAGFVYSMKLAFGSLEGTELNTEAMNSIIAAATSLAELQSHLEPIGGVITWFAGRDDLSTFGYNAASFVYSMKTAFGALEGAELNVEAMDSIIAAATSLATLQSHLEPIGGVITWFSGRDDLGTFGTNVYYFVQSMIVAFSSLEGVELNTDAMNSIIAAATSLATLQSSLEPIGGVISWFTGRDDLGTFGYSVAAFIGSMKTAMSTLDGATFNVEAMNSIITAATKLAEFQSTLEPMGGVVSWFAGRDDLGTFGTNLGLFADAMSKLKQGMGEDGITEATITSITNTGTALIELQKALPEEHWFDGKMNLSDFSKRIDDFATAMGTFGSKASEIDPSAVSTVISTAYRIKYLIESLTDLDTSGLQTFTGIGTGGFGADGAAYEIAQTIAEFSNKVAGINTEAVSVSVWAAQRLKTLINSLSTLDTSGVELFKPQTIGSAMRGYADKVAGIDTGVVASSITSANRLKNFIASLAGLDTSGIGNFKVDSIGTSLKSYGASVSGMNILAVSSSITAANKVKNFIGSLAGLNTSGVGSFKSAIDKLSTVDVSKIVKAFSGASSKMNSAGADMINGLIKGMQSKLSVVKSSIGDLLSGIIGVMRKGASKFEDAGGAMITRMSGGMTSKKSNVTSAITSCLSTATTTIRGKYDSFYSAGSYLADGLANGISANAYKAAAKAKAMAEAAVKAAREALKINSPSKVFKEIGSGIPEGFAMGIGMLGGDVKQSVTDMASTAIKSTRSTMGTILDALSADMDAQPTIRPVVDLTDVRTGANAINGMLNGAQTIGVRSNLNAINYAMNAKLQNGSNDDVISAINKLRDGLETNRGDVYNFGDFTYDDGDNISDAVRTLVRAAKMGRRV